VDDIHYSGFVSNQRANSRGSSSSLRKWNFAWILLFSQWPGQDPRLLSDLRDSRSRRRPEGSTWTCAFLYFGRKREINRQSSFLHQILHRRSQKRRYPICRKRWRSAFRRAFQELLVATKQRDGTCLSAYDWPFGVQTLGSVRLGICWRIQYFFSEIRHWMQWGHQTIGSRTRPIYLGPRRAH
jgi:hypothetical protein